ncbi:hypothetical protein DRH14_03815 [Candidatus Shapirobacteria bacterium]|nr:MAG: hypothetical protein DRH14_03815 [Candidatus Shapirobacteria bacterium]
MSYDAVRNYIVGRLNGQGFAESQAIDDYTDAPSSEYGNTFILKALSGEMDDENSETIVDRFYDAQTWQAQIAFSKTDIDRDELHRKRELIMKDLDNPANWSDTVRIMKYGNWSVEMLDSYFILTINIKIVDTYIY